jgi:hypothetical protein
VVLVEEISLAEDPIVDTPDKKPLVEEPKKPLLKNKNLRKFLKE